MEFTIDRFQLGIRANQQNANNRLINDFRNRTGMSLLYPSLPSGY